MGVLWLIFEMNFSKEVFLAFLQTCLHLAWAILKFVMFSCVLFALAFLSMCLLCLPAWEQSLLNQDLFFLGCVLSFSMFLSAISNSLSVKCSIVLFSVFVLRSDLHSCVKANQFAFLKLKYGGGVVCSGETELIVMW